jgi:hypothetical protein
VDPTSQPEIREWIPQKKGVQWALTAIALPVFRAVPSIISPTRELGKVLTDLAMGDGGKLEGKGVEGEGRTVNNVGMRRMAGI